jgi:hypothetical protein
MSTWQELSTRENDGLLVSLLWSRDSNAVKVVVADTKLHAQFELAVAPERALDAFNHPFLYARPGVPVAAPTCAQEVAA